MKALLPVLALSGHLVSSTAAADTNLPAHFILDQATGFDRAAWETATDAIEGRRELVRTYIFTGDKRVVGRAQQDAAKANAQQAIYLVNVKVPAKDSYQFRRLLPGYEEEMRKAANSGGARLVAEWPMCALFKPGTDGVNRPMQSGVILLIDHPQAAVHCYLMVQFYYLTPPDPGGERVAPMIIEPKTIALQAMLPPMKPARKVLADKAAYKQGRLVKHPTAVYAPGEEIFIYAFLRNVGRKNVGMPTASYEIGLDVEVRDREGKVLRSFPGMHTFRGESPPPFPITIDYFTNYLTAGIAIHEPGDYTLAYIFHDHSRQDTPPLTMEFDVTVD